MTDKKMTDETTDLAALMMHLHKNDDVREEFMLLVNSLTSPIEKAIRMDLRDYFAAQALQGVCSISVDDWPQDWKDNRIAPMHHAAKACYLLADAMMKARDGGEDE